ncbi:hypothetical protein N7536_002527 [Penicillium majusculum]|nr:hypothetical protein N7536_002527 [Penicillium majusculum]
MYSVSEADLHVVPVDHISELHPIDEDTDIGHQRRVEGVTINLDHALVAPGLRFKYEATLKVSLVYP